MPKCFPPFLKEIHVPLEVWSLRPCKNNLHAKGMFSCEKEFLPEEKILSVRI